MADQASAPIT